jgi:hypothetical protein
MFKTKILPPSSKYKCIRRGNVVVIVCRQNAKKVGIWNMARDTYCFTVLLRPGGFPPTLKEGSRVVFYKRRR